MTAYPDGDYSTSHGVEFDEGTLFKEIERDRSQDQRTRDRIAGDRANLRRAMSAWAWEEVFEFYRWCEEERIETGADLRVEHRIPLARDDEKRRRRTCGLHCAANLKVVKPRKRR